MADDDAESDADACGLADTWLLRWLAGPMSRRMRCFGSAIHQVGRHQPPLAPQDDADHAEQAGPAGPGHGCAHAYAWSSSRRGLDSNCIQ